MKHDAQPSFNLRRQVVLMLILLILACLLTFYFRSVLGLGTVFTHFFYIPIILACVWWKRKGLIVTLFLALLFLLSPRFLERYTLILDDYLRATMLFAISLVVVYLTERLSLVQGELKSSEDTYRTVFETTGTAMVIIDVDTSILLANAEFEKLSGFSKKEVEGLKSFIDFISPRDKDKVLKYHRERRLDATDTPKSYEIELTRRAGDTREVVVTIDMIPETQKSVASFSDVTELMLALSQQNILQNQLSDALAKVLSGFIPICANCKKTRDEHNNWVPIEGYIQDRTEASFSHGICPECARKLYPELMKDDRLISKSR